ncbi:unnamed protein product [Caenorhabditis angaria]|uniref:Leprecan-like alpha-helical domain-containing protein n=1 Tax=Caenorhabditis angaria TaxID=860376 RepID=A0A9P1IP29_9PELO|nr:unnamed protein product [Caenorhabditis angaria]
MIVLFLLFQLIILNFAQAHSDQVLTFEEYFKSGKVEYTEKNWPDCVAFMKRANDDFKQYQDEMIACRQKCEKLIKPADKSEKLSMFHETSERALCIMRCKRDRLTERHPGVRKMDVYFDMMERKPYQYIHICYWQLGELAMAVQSAYTFLVANPEDRDILSSLNFYMKQPGFDNSMLIDMERKDYEAKFINGVEAYDEQDWGRCVHEFEFSLEKSLKEDEKCRLLCQDKIDWTLSDVNPDIEVLFASIRASIVQCEQNCLYKLARINGYNVGNLIAAHYEYLHFCQFKLSRGSEACQSVANYLLFDDNPLMRRNKYFYLKQYGKLELFVPEEKIIRVYAQRAIEKRYLDFIDQRFRFDENNELKPEQADDHNPLNTQIHIEDNFAYEQVPEILKDPKECKILRSALPETQLQPFLEELGQRVKKLWPNSKFESVSCGSEVREAKCPRAIVLSAENSDCGEWLGRWFSGCAVVFCD